jgi:hypothetical protein
MLFNDISISIENTSVARKVSIVRCNVLIQLTRASLLKISVTSCPEDFDQLFSEVLCWLMTLFSSLPASRQYFRRMRVGLNCLRQSPP